jgi:hypothetical protein
MTFSPTDPPLTDAELLRNAELLLGDAGLMALSTNLECDWAYYREVRKCCDRFRLKLGLPSVSSSRAS